MTLLLERELFADDLMTDLEVAVAFENTIVHGDDVDHAMRYAKPSVVVHLAGSAPCAGPVIGKQGLIRLRNAVHRLCVFDDAAETEFYLATPGLIVGRIRRPARLRSTGEPFDFNVTEWITVEDGLVTDVEVFFWENAPLARCAEALSCQ